MVHSSLQRFGVASIVAALCIQTVVVPTLSANDLLPHHPAPNTFDTAARHDGMIHGRLVDPRGNGISQAPLQLTQGHQVLATVATDATGQFTIPAPAPGVYQLTGGTWVHSLRIWATGTAPPAARNGIQIVAPEPIVAGQVAPLRYWMANPNVMLATAAIAIAIPIILFNQSQNRAGAS